MKEQQYISLIWVMIWEKDMVGFNLNQLRWINSFVSMISLSQRLYLTLSIELFEPLRVSSWQWNA